MHSLTESDYHNIYYSLLLFFFFLAFILRQDKNDKNWNLPYCSLIILSLGILLGGRDKDIGTDTSTYYEWYVNYSSMQFDSLYEYFLFGGDPIFKVVLHFLGLFLSFNGVLFVIAVTISILNYWFACETVKLTGYGSVTILFISLMASACTWGEMVNIIRAGIGTGLVLVYLIFLYRRRYKLAILFGILAIGNHFSTAIFVVLGLTPILFRLPLKTYNIIFILALLASALGYSVLSLGVFDGIGLEKAANYTSNIEQSDFKTGFRPTFALYNLGFYLVAIGLKRYVSGIVKYNLEFYALASALFFLWFAIPYSNRIGNFSWSVIPVILYLPMFAKFKKYPFISPLAVLAYGMFSCFAF